MKAKIFIQKSFLLTKKLCIMKKILLLFGSILILLNGFSQFQYNYYADHKHAHDINITQINDGSNDLLIANNLFDSQSSSHVIHLKRLDANNSIVWSKFYAGSTLANARIFDVDNYFDLLFITGSVEDAGVRKLFVAKIEAFSGDMLDAKVYDIPGPTFNSTGLKILASYSDANGDGTDNHGMLVTGYFSSCNTLDFNCNLNAGFVMRIDLNLDVFWALEMESIVPGSSFDYDFINGATETQDGFFLTGSATGENSLGQIRQSVFAHKIDFEGNSLWDASYIFGNSNDISVDAYFDMNTDEIFMLTNYSNTHQFAVTVLDNATGNVVPAKSWYTNSANMDYYGFSIMRSLTDPDNLVITGYIREYFDGAFFNESNVFIYEFEKATGNQVGDSYHYDVYHQVATNDEYDFWNGQMPLVYYPDISLIKSDINSSYYATVGYRTNADGFTETELFVVESDKRNACDRINLNFTNQLQTLNPISSVSVGTTPYSSAQMHFNENTMPIIEGSCTHTVFVEDENQSQDINIYPNPANDYIYIDGGNFGSFTIRDASGRSLLSSSEKNTGSVFIGNLAKGIYFISIYHKDNKNETYRFVKR
jgi:hypothetical protein